MVNIAITNDVHSRYTGDWKRKRKEKEISFRNVGSLYTIRRAYINTEIIIDDIIVADNDATSSLYKRNLRTVNDNGKLSSDGRGAIVTKDLKYRD